MHVTHLHLSQHNDHQGSKIARLDRFCTIYSNWVHTDCIYLKENLFVFAHCKKISVLLYIMYQFLNSKPGMRLTVKKTVHQKNHLNLLKHEFC